MRIEFWYDVVCPWAYLASTRVEDLAARTGVELVWRPMLLGGLFRHHGAPDRPTDGAPPARLRIGARDLLHWAERLGVPIAPPPEHPRRTVDAMRLCVRAPAEVRAELSKELFRAYWVQGRDVADRAVLGAVARAFSVDPAAITSDEARHGLFAATAEAAAKGIFGAPSFSVGDRFWWGVDRMNVVEDAISGACAIRPPQATPRSGGGRVVFFHDFSSPFSYLAASRIDEVAARHGAEVEWVPILLGALFREIGTPDVPLLAMHAAKQAWMRRDMEEQAGRHGIPFRFASTFPLRTVTALRVAIVEPRATGPMYRAAWAADRDVGDERVLAGVLDDAGLDGGGLVAATRDPAVKERLRANTERAKVAGACGVPTFLVRDQLFWGQDRLELVEAALDGWKPEAGA
jgi:2-hydroxychromene-2-carboxylate isomerase